MSRKDIHTSGKETRFSKERQPKTQGRPLGVKNRSTILSKWLSTNLELVHPITREKQRGTVEDEVILALVTKARRGDVTAIRECLDTMYGKIKETHELTILGLDAAKEAMSLFLAEHPSVKLEDVAPIYAQTFNVQESDLIQ